MVWNRAQCCTRDGVQRFSRSGHVFYYLNYLPSRLQHSFNVLPASSSNPFHEKFPKGCGCETQPLLTCEAAIPGSLLSWHAPTVPGSVEEGHRMWGHREGISSSHSKIRQSPCRYASCPDTRSNSPSSAPKETPLLKCLSVFLLSTSLSKKEILGLGDPESWGEGGGKEVFQKEREAPLTAALSRPPYPALPLPSPLCVLQTPLATMNLR